MPKLGFVYLVDTEWKSQGFAQLQGGLGWVGGVQFTFGSEATAFTLGFDYLDAAYDVNITNDTHTASDPKLEIRGSWWTAGIILRF